MKPSDFYTRPRSEEGVRVPLLRHDGTDSGEWIRVLGPDSRAFVKAVTVMRRRYAELGEIDSDEREAAAEQILLDYRAALIVGWSFEEPATPEAVREFIENAPLVGNQVDLVANDRPRFFGPGSPSSTNGRKSNANSEEEAGMHSSGDLESSAVRARLNSNTSSVTGKNSTEAA